MTVLDNRHPEAANFPRHPEGLHPEPSEGGREGRGGPLLKCDALNELRDFLNRSLGLPAEVENQPEGLFRVGGETDRQQAASPQTNHCSAGLRSGGWIATPFGLAMTILDATTCD
jgi:hypothetical protein